MRRFAWILYVALAAASAGCAARRFTPPSDPGTPLPDFAAVYQEVSAGCATVRTFTLEMRLSGTAGGDSMRGRVVAGFERPSSMRLEGLAPIGQPAFILAATGEMATLLLPRDGPRVLRDASAAAILGALTGVTMAPGDLQAVLTGCVMPGPRAASGRLHAGGTASIDLEGDAVLYLRRNGEGWGVRAARRGAWEIEYPAWQGQFPSEVRLRSESPVAVDLTAVLSQIEANIELPPEAFAVNVPPAADELTIQELREAGPLSGQ